MRYSAHVIVLAGLDAKVPGNDRHPQAGGGGGGERYMTGSGDWCGCKYSEQLDNVRRWRTFEGSDKLKERK